MSSRFHIPDLSSKLSEQRVSGVSNLSKKYSKNIFFPRKQMNIVLLFQKSSKYFTQKNFTFEGSIQKNFNYLSADGHDSQCTFV